ncbi:MAG: GspE/PulE family protein [bacterium]
MQKVIEPALSLLRRILLSSDRKLLDELRRRSTEILKELERLREEEHQALFELDGGQVSLEWLAEVYSALSSLATEEVHAIENDACVKQLLDARTEWEDAIGKAFAEALLPSWLPDNLRNVGAWFDTLDKVPPRRVQELRDTPAVKAGGPISNELCMFGITPLTVYQATQAVYLLVDRLGDYEHLKRGDPILLTTSTDPTEKALQQLDPASVVTEIAEYADCSREAAQCLLQWLIQLAQYHPQLFYQLEATPHGRDGLLLKVLLDAKSNVYERWSVQKAVVRVLGSGQAPNVHELGFEPADLERILRVVQNPQGMFLMAGPTGSGKSTSLYSLLNYRKGPEVNIITVEDPVEYQLPGINQVQINPKTGLTFAAALRSCLREDPDIILVGEIRDHETAEVAFHASMTGHLVLSTLHADNAPATISRLLDLGIDPFVVSSSVIMVTAQRLVRKLCQNCKAPYTPAEHVVKRLSLSPDAVYYRGTGCPQCGFSGFSGRSGIYELLTVNQTVREAINKKVPEAEIRKAAIRAGGYSSLLQKGLAKVKGGLITPDELLRVLQVEEESARALSQGLGNLP